MTVCDMCGELAMNTLTLCQECKDHVDSIEEQDEEAHECTDECGYF